MSSTEAGLSESTVHLAHEFLSALFMAVRTAQIHDPSNTAFTSALDRVFDASLQLYTSTGGFDLQLVEGSYFVNGVRLRFAGGAWQTMDTLRELFAERKLGGISLRQPPQPEDLKRLVMAIAANPTMPGEQSRAEALAGVNISLLGPQTFGQTDSARINRSLFAVHAYAKLVLGYREHAAMLSHGFDGQEHWTPRIRVPRVIQDLVELSGDRLDLLLRLACNRRDLPREELLAATACLVSVALGRGLGLDRRALMDLGMSGFFLGFGERLAKRDSDSDASTAAALAFLLAASEAKAGSYTRAMVLAEQSELTESIRSEPRRPHPFSRIVRVARAFAERVSGWPRVEERQQTPLAAVTGLWREPATLDVALVDLLANLMRVFPDGMPVLLQEQGPAIVIEQSRGRHDCPRVRLTDGTEFDLTRRRGEDFVDSIRCSQAFAGLQAPGPAPIPQVKLPSFTPSGAEAPAPLPSLADLARHGAPARPQTADLVLDRGRFASGIRAAPEPPREVEVSHSEGEDKLLGSYIAGKYRIVRKLGEGGMGIVYLARQEPIDRDVAIKVLLSSLVRDKIAIGRFEREAQTISRLRHPNTVTVYDFGRTSTGDLYLVMEYLAGQTLGQLLMNHAPLNGQRAARIIIQVAGALAEAHEAGVVHRDLKPDNIILTRIGTDADWVKVLDFGLAKVLDSEQAALLTQQGRIFGTPRYMSPEQAQDKPIDGRSDLYSLGIILYELLTGQPPFVADSMYGLLMKHVTELPPRPSDVCPEANIDPELEAVVLKSIAKRPEHRYVDVRGMARALSPFAEEPDQLLPSASHPEIDDLIEDAFMELSHVPPLDPSAQPFAWDDSDDDGA